MASFTVEQDKDDANYELLMMLVGRVRCSLHFICPD